MNKRGFIFRFLFSLILGFLPSFLFIFFFIQYGSPFSNYINFLSDFQQSWMAWGAALIITLLVYSILTLIKRKRAGEGGKGFLIVFILLLLIVVLLVSFQLYLYTNFILGSDVLVRVDADRENIFFSGNLTENVTFKISALMNPYCMSECEYKFSDISNNNIIDAGSFNLTSLFSKYKTYTLNREHTNQSQILNRFEVSCKSKRTLLCYTSGRESKRKILITVNYVAVEQDQAVKESVRNKLALLGGNVSVLSKRLDVLSKNVYSINGSFSNEDFLFWLVNSSLSFYELNKSFGNLIDLWNSQEFQIISDKISEAESKSKTLREAENKWETYAVSNISLYNRLIGSLDDSRQILKAVPRENISEQACSELNSGVSSLNQAILKFKTKLDLSYAENLVKNISIDAKTINESSSTGSSCSLNEDFLNENLTKIKLVYFNESVSEISLPEPPQICCFSSKCNKCCDENCSGKYYPVVFLHGHSFNKGLSADYSFDIFDNLKKMLESEGYLDAGNIVISPETEDKGLWGRANAPVECTASYFFDVYKTESSKMTVQSKTDSIDTYSIRMRDIINTVKHRTGKDKVIVVAHSMGGLVTRRYMQIFGAKEIDKIILIDVPNHGVDEKISSYCSLFGSEPACNDMNKNSIFINKLNNEPSELVPTYNIIGIGCNMGDETGDGIVKNSSQYLSYATNYYIEGSCDELSFKFLHGEIVDPEKYPEIHNIVNKTIR